MTEKNYIYKKLPDGRYIKEIDNKVEHLASAEEDAKLAEDIRSLLQGPQGESGTSGTSGQDGTSGRDGQKGDIGRTGLTGPRGQNGTSGSSGSSGVNGTSGVDGQKGEKGDRGFKGDKGDRGERGFPGLQGPAGRDGTSGGGSGSGTSGSSGTSGTSGAAGISAGQVYYFDESQNSDVSGYKLLDINPSTASQQTVTTSLTSNQQGVLISDYMTPQLGFAVIPGGVQRFHTHLLKEASNDSIEYYVEIQLANSSGTPIGPTLSSGKSLVGWVDASTPVEVTVDLTLPTTTIDPTNRMIVRLYLDNNDNNSHSVVYYTEGTSYYSFVLTSVGVIGSTSGSSGTSGIGSGGIHSSYVRSGQFANNIIGNGTIGPGQNYPPTDIAQTVFYPYYPASSFSINRIQTEVISLNKAGASYFVSFYSDLGGYPNTRLYKSDPFDQSTIAIKSNTATFSFTAGTKYWTAFSVDRQSSFRNINVASLLGFGFTQSVVYNAFTIATASSSLPATISPQSLTLASLSTGNPLVNMLVV